MESPVSKLTVLNFTNPWLSTGSRPCSTDHFSGEFLCLLLYNPTFNMVECSLHVVKLKLMTPVLWFQLSECLTVLLCQSHWLSTQVKCFGLSLWCSTVMVLLAAHSPLILLLDRMSCNRNVQWWWMYTSRGRLCWCVHVWWYDFVCTLHR